MYGHNFGFSEWWCGPGTFFPGIAGLFVNLLFWGLIIYLLVSLFQVIFKRKSKDETTCGDNSPLNILKIRYARGEITGEEFERMKTTLR